jgi:hypothetical protein
MKVATFQGTVENGQIRLPAGVRLPEKARVGYSGAGCAQSRVRVVGRPVFDVERAEIIWELKSRLINKD